MFWVTNGGKQILNAGYAAHSLSGGRGGNHDILEPRPCSLKPELDKDDFIVDYAFGQYYCLFVTNKGYVYSGGNNDQGQLGHNDTTTIPYFRRVISTAGGVLFGPGGERAVRCYTNIDYGSGAQRRSMILTESKLLYGCGYNANYELGISGNTTQQNAFVRAAPTISDIKDVYVGKFTSGAVLTNGQFYTWGLSSNGEQGLGNTTTQQVPVLSNSNVALVRHAWNGSNNRFCFILKTDGTVWFTGFQSTYGQAGLGNLTDYTSWQQVTNALINNTSSRVVDIQTSGYSADANQYATTWFLMDNGTIYSCGYNGYGQMGWNFPNTSSNALGAFIIPAGFPKVDQIFQMGGYSVSAFYGINKASGRMFAVGSWNFGSLGYGIGDWAASSGVGNWVNRTATTFRAHWPAREIDAPPVIEDGLAKFHSIVGLNISEYTAAQASNPMVLCTDGTVWTRGYNANSHLGIGNTHSPNGQANYIRREESQFMWRPVLL
jgi:alpha-tubulin suppressor-like RCC1 family protein